jgi:hypothetical protein
MAKSQTRAGSATPASRNFGLRIMRTPIGRPIVQVSAVVADRPELFHVPERDFPAAASATTYAVVAPPPAVPVAQVMRRPVMAPRLPQRRGRVFSTPVVIVNAQSEAQER